MSKTIRTSRKGTRMLVERPHPLPPVEDSLVPEPQDDETSPGEHSFIYSPSRRRTRGDLCVTLPMNPSSCVSGLVLNVCRVCVSASRAETVGPNEESATPATRSRRRVNQDVAAQVNASFKS